MTINKANLNLSTMNLEQLQEQIVAKIRAGKSLQRVPSFSGERSILPITKELALK